MNLPTPTTTEPTPRTDAALRPANQSLSQIVVPAYFARTLERDLATATAALARSEELIGKLLYDAGYEGGVAFWVSKHDAGMLRELEVRSQLATTQQQLAAALERVATTERTSDLYSELIYAVATKYDGESRHDTALRYIRQAENKESGPDQELRDAARPDAEKETK